MSFQIFSITEVKYDQNMIKLADESPAYELDREK